MNKSTIVSILFAAIALVVAWWLVGFIFHAVYVIVKLVIVIVVAVAVYFLLRSMLTRA